MWHLVLSHVLRTPQEPLRNYNDFFWKSEDVGASRGQIWKGYCDTVQRMNKMDITSAEELVKAFNPVSEQTNPTLAVTASFPVRFLHDILVTHQRWKPSNGPSIRIYGSSMTLACLGKNSLYTAVGFENFFFLVQTQEMNSVSPLLFSVQVIIRRKEKIIIIIKKC